MKPKSHHYYTQESDRVLKIDKKLPLIDREVNIFAPTPVTRMRSSSERKTQKTFTQITANHKIIQNKKRKHIANNNPSLALIVIHI